MCGRHGSRDAVVRDADSGMFLMDELFELQIGKWNGKLFVEGEYG